jgi:predicted metal-dependent hydrolase
MNLEFIEDAPIVDEYVYGEAFPDKNKIWIQIVAPYASVKDITQIICHELIHLKFPELDHDSNIFENMVRDCMNK